MDKLLLQPGQIRLRHIKQGASTDPGAVQVLGQYLAPQDRQDLNNLRSRFRTGSYVRREGQEGEFSLRFWNTPRNRKRFAILANRASYQPSDEWIEIYETTGEAPTGDLLFVGTPTQCVATLTTITISGVDGLWLQKKQRETDAGFWNHAPRDVFEHYCRNWICPLADDFATTGRLTYNAGAQQTTADGVWDYFRCGEDTAYPGTVKLDGGSTAYLTGRQTLPDGPTTHWRIETTILQNVTATGSFELHAKGAGGADNVYLAINDLGAALTSVGVEIGFADSAHYTQTIAAATRFYDVSLGAPRAYPMSLAIERRTRWYFFYVNGTLIHVAPCGTGSGTVTPELVAYNGAIGLVDSVMTRSGQSLLQRAGIGGDLRLPSTTMPTGGLKGTYFDDHDLPALPAGTLWWNRILDPTRDKASSKAVVIPARLDSSLSFANAAAFNVPVANTEYFSVRWTGAIYLDLDNVDYAFRTTVDDRARVWIGKTRYGEQIIDDWTSGHGNVVTTSTWLKAGSAAGSPPSGATGPLAGQGSGWYPIVIEYSNGAGSGAFILEHEKSNAVGTWSVPAANVLSPYGIVNSQVRGDSFYEQLLALKSSWGYQFTCEPKSLESGEFPGRVVPVRRQGRDTDIVIDKLEGLSPQTSINAEDTVTALRCDAQGIADPLGTSQLTREAIDYTQVRQHMAIMSDYESLSDITYAPLLEQRARSLLALRGAPFEEIQVQPSGRRGLTDSWPLTGTPSKMNWLPGDAARLKIYELGVDDLTPRPMIEISWPLRPAGRGRPSVRWRQRTRNFEQLFRKSLRVGLSNDRNYQTQFVAVPGSVGTHGFAAGQVGVDDYSRVSLPNNIADIKRATLIVQGITGTWTIEVNGTSTGIVVAAAGRYDITPYVAKPAGNQLMYARLISGGTNYTIAIELLVAT